MTNEEKIILGVAAVALAAVVIYQRPLVAAPIIEHDPVADNVSLTPYNDSVTKGPSYMAYNSPFAFAPPISNFLPSITAGQAGQTINTPTDFAGFSPYVGSCGCE